MDKKIDTLVRVSELYYQQNLSQNTISEIMGVSRPTVSRLLEEARSVGVVEIVIHSPVRKNPELSQELRTKLGLRDVIVVAGEYDHDAALKKCAEATINFLGSIIENNITIGISWGRALQNFCELLPNGDYYNINIVQMAGCLGNGNPSVDGLELAIRISKKLNGTYANIYAPVFVDSELVYSYLMKENQIQNTLKKSNKTDIILTGIGVADDKEGSIYRAGYFSEKEIQEIIDRGAVGHLLARWIDINGNELFYPGRYTISAPLEALRNAEWSIGICASAEKAKATLAAVNGKYINTLVTDESLAKELLNLIKLGLLKK